MRGKKILVLIIALALLLACIVESEEKDESPSNKSLDASGGQKQ